MYDQNSFLVVAILFTLILAAYEGGFRIGRYFQRQTDSEIKLQTGTIQAGVLGLLALLTVMVVFIIIDLDRPARGIIKVKQDSMMELLQLQ